MVKYPRELLQWAEMVSTHLPHLSKSQSWVIALYSFGIMVIGQCGRTSVAQLLAGLLERQFDAVNQQLRESVCDATDKQGAKRREVDVTRCFAPLLRWVLAWWASDEKRLALALDASTLGQRFTVLAVSVLYRGCAIPVAWVVLPVTRKNAWMPHWKRLLRHLRGAVPADWTVIVLTDRGLYSKDLFRAVQRNYWHPFMRINTQGNFRDLREDHFRPLTHLVPRPGTFWCGAVVCFSTQSARLRCTLLTRWDPGFDTPWLILTDLAPNQADSLWYGLRGWIEQGFKDCKRGGFRWEQTKMTDPARATRLWLMLALATLRLLSLTPPDPISSCASGLTAPMPQAERSLPPRPLSLFRRGWLALLVALIRHQPLPSGRFVPAPWPHSRFSFAVFDLICRGPHPVFR